MHLVIGNKTENKDALGQNSQSTNFLYTVKIIIEWCGLAKCTKRQTEKHAKGEQNVSIKFLEIF